MPCRLFALWGGRDLDDPRRPRAQAVEVSRRPMREQRPGSAGEHCGHPAPALRDPPVAHGKHAAMQTMEPPARDPASDSAGAEPERQ